MLHIQMLIEKRLAEEAAVREMEEKEREQVEASITVNVSHLEIPAELAVIIQSLSGTKNYKLF